MGCKLSYLFVRVFLVSVFFFVCLFFFCDRLGRVSANGAYLNLLLFRAGLSLLNTTFAQYWKASFWEWWWIFLFSCNSFLFASFFFYWEWEWGEGMQGRIGLCQDCKYSEGTKNWKKLVLMSGKFFLQKYFLIETTPLRLVDYLFDVCKS